MLARPPGKKLSVSERGRLRNNKQKSRSKGKLWGEVRSKRGRWGIRVRQRKTDRLENVLDSLVLLTSANDVIDGRQIKTVFSFHLMDKEFEITGGPRKTGARDRLWCIEVK